MWCMLRSHEWGLQRLGRSMMQLDNNALLSGLISHDDSLFITHRLIAL